MRNARVFCEQIDAGGKESQRGGHHGRHQANFLPIMFCFSILFVLRSVLLYKVSELKNFIEYFNKNFSVNACPGINKNIIILEFRSGANTYLHHEEDNHHSTE